MIVATGVLNVYCIVTFMYYLFIYFYVPFSVISLALEMILL